VVFEDAELGVEAAKRGSFHCVGIDRDAAPWRLRGADIVVGDLAEIDRDRLVRLCGGG
jgi:beta-phosphoglucomutase-like phosphatase (HAD superfamily)